MKFPCCVLKDAIKKACKPFKGRSSQHKMQKLRYKTGVQNSRLPSCSGQAATLTSNKKKENVKTEENGDMTHSR